MESMTVAQSLCACAKGAGPAICYALSLVWGIISAFLLLLGCQSCVDNLTQKCSSLFLRIRGFFEGILSGAYASSPVRSEGIAMGITPAHVTQTTSASDGRGVYSQIPRAVPLADVEEGDSSSKPLEKGRVSI